MTFELRLVDVSGFKNPEYIYVDGSQAGQLRLFVKRLPQLIKCSKDDHLVFKVCGPGSDQEPVNIISQIHFHGKTQADIHRESFSADKQTQYVKEGFDGKDVKLGTLTFKVKYDKGKFYSGELQFGQAAKRQNYLPFYKGKCASFNLFNCLDTQPQTSKFNFVERVYRDD